MMLLTKANRAALPQIGSTDGQGDSAKVIVKFFNPSGSGTWYATEFDGEDRFFGLVCGLGQDELGYFLLSELSSVKGPFGLGIERDRHLGSLTIGEARERG